MALRIKLHKFFVQRKWFPSIYQVNLSKSKKLDFAKAEKLRVQQFIKRDTNKNVNLKRFLGAWIVVYFKYGSIICKYEPCKKNAIMRNNWKVAANNNLSIFGIKYSVQNILGGWHINHDAASTYSNVNINRGKISLFVMNWLNSLFV